LANYKFIIKVDVHSLEIIVIYILFDNPILSDNPILKFPLGVSNFIKNLHIIMLTLRGDKKKFKKIYYEYTPNFHVYR
jgi:hypothetical protein